jgi:2-dehydro-3-deoxygluconokinase
MLNHIFQKGFNMKHIAIIGECMIELNGKPFGEMRQTFGGDTLNAAVYLSRSCALNINQNDIKISYVSSLGNDPISDGMLTRWQGENINTDLVLRDHKRTPGLYLIQLDEQGERTFLYWRNQSAARYLLQHPGFEQIKAQLINLDMIFLSGISLAILPDKDLIELLKLLADLRNQGVEIAFDSNFRPALWPNDDQLKTVQNAFATMYQATDLALVTFDDEQLIWGDKTPQDTLIRLQQQGVKKAVVKLGVDGCLIGYFANKVTLSVPTVPVKVVVDTTSAGDSFNGGFLSCYLTNGNLEQSCQRGNALAGIVIQHRGAIIAKSATDVVTNKH